MISNTVFVFKIRPYGTTSNEAFHNEIKGFFRNVRFCIGRFAKSHAQIITAAKLIYNILKRQGYTTVRSQSDLLFHLSAFFKTESVIFDPRLDLETVPNPFVNADSLPPTARRIRMRPARAP